MSVVFQEEYFVRQAAGLLVEGVGFGGNGSYFLWGRVSVLDTGLVHVTMKGWTAAMEMAKMHGGTVTWWGNVALVREGNAGPFMPLKLNRNGPELWGNNVRNGVRYVTIGAATVKLPASCKPGEYRVRVAGGYDYNRFTPMPMKAEHEVSVSLCAEEGAA